MFKSLLREWSFYAEKKEKSLHLHFFFDFFIFLCTIFISKCVTNIFFNMVYKELHLVLTILYSENDEK